jgi:hypothetical protein
MHQKHPPARTVLSAKAFVGKKRGIVSRIKINLNFISPPISGDNVDE